MNETHASKVTASHLKRNAYLYVRQSSLRQVIENTESRERQYALRQRAIALGWQQDQIVVIDTDLGQSAASTVDRAGFQQLVAEVGMGYAGIILGLEVSRLARNCADWHRLLEIAAVTDTLILDEDGIYDPAHFNDRLLLGLKGTMSEAELHVLRARLRGGILNKARKGELRSQLPTGLVYDPAGRVTLDPDEQVQQSIRLLFATFKRTGTACSTVKYFNENGISFPKRVQSGPLKDEIVWERTGLSRVLTILKSPRYAGAYVYGRRGQQLVDGRTRTVMKPRDEWLVLLLDAHPGYISWEEHERIQERLRESARAYGIDRRRGPPREGSGLLQGLAVCGRCGRRMIVRYHNRYGRPVPDYLCVQLAAKYRDHSYCQQVPGAGIDDAVANLLVETMTPMALELSLAVQKEIRGRLEEADRLRCQQVERAEYEVDLARSRYMRVDPSNRLVACSLEADWNDKLRALEHAREERERARAADEAKFDERQRERILALANDFPKLWHASSTPQRERKRMAALLIEDVTLVKDDDITMHVRFRGGRTQTLTVPRPLSAWELRQTPPETLALMDKLFEEHNDAEVAAALNEHGHKTGAGEPFTAKSVDWARRAAGLKTLYQRLRAKGMLTAAELCRETDLTYWAIRQLRKRGLLRGRQAKVERGWLYEPPDRQPDEIIHHVKSAQANASSAPDDKAALTPA